MAASLTKTARGGWHGLHHPLGQGCILAGERQRLGLVVSLGARRVGVDDTRPDSFR